MLEGLRRSAWFLAQEGGTENGERQHSDFHTTALTSHITESIRLL